MKFSQIIFALFLICFVGFSFAYSQNNSQKEKPKKEKSDEKKIDPKPVEIKANLMVLNADGKFADDIKLEDLKIYEDGVEQKITRFAKKDYVLNIGLVMDNTASMRNQLGKITAAGLAFVANLRPEDEAFVVRFVDSSKVEILRDWTTDKKLIANVLQDMYTEGGQSAIIDALYLSAEKLLIREKTDKSKRSALVLITDGEDRDSYYESQELFELLRGSDVQIFVIGLTQDLSDQKNEYNQKKNSKTNAENLIKSLALETGGAAFIVQGNNKEIETALVQSLKAILTELSFQYIVGYTSTNQKRDGLARKLTVQVADNAKGEKRQTIIRESFTIPNEKTRK